MHWMGWGVFVPALMLAAQSEVGPRARVASAAPEATTTTVEIVKVIDDPQTGKRWLLLKNQQHPGGPGQLVPVDASLTTVAGQIARPLPSQPMIRSGDPVVVEEQTPLLEARYEAVALCSAAKGKAMNVRLKVNGKVLHAVALGPGRVALAAVPGGRP